MKGVAKMREWPWMPVVLASVAACAFLALLGIAYVFAGTWIEAGIDASVASQISPAFVVLGTPALAAWGISIVHRCLNRTARIVLGVLAVAMLVWLGAACIISALGIAGEIPLYTIAATSDTLIALIVELCIDTGAIPSVRRYRDLFERLPLDLKVLTGTGRMAYHTDQSRQLDVTTQANLARHLSTSSPDNTALAVHASSQPSTIYKLYRLNAGLAVLTEDTETLDALRERLEHQRTLLTNQNEFLRRSRDMQALVYQQRREAELTAHVERDLQDTAVKIRTILDSLAPADTPEGRAERTSQLNLVKVLVAYSKRKGMLALASAENEALTGDQIAVITREAMADLHSIGIECAVLVTANEPLTLTGFNMIYDCFYDCVIGVLPYADPFIMTNISVTEDGKMEMRTRIECGMGLEPETAVETIPLIASSTAPWTSMQQEIADGLQETLAQRGIWQEVALDEGLVNIVVRVDNDSSTLGGER